MAAIGFIGIQQRSRRKEVKAEITLWFEAIVESHVAEIDRIGVSDHDVIDISDHGKRIAVIGTHKRLPVRKGALTFCRDVSPCDFWL